MNNPSLLEPGAKYFFNETLKNANRKNSSYKNNLVNLGLFLFFYYYFRIIIIL